MDLQTIQDKFNSMDIARQTVQKGGSQFTDLYSLRRSEILKVQKNALYRQVQFVQDHSPFYREFLGDHGVFQKRDAGKLNVTDLPILTKEILTLNIFQR